MLKIDQDDIRRIAGQLDTLYTTLKCYVYYTEIINKLDKQKDNAQYWEFIEFTLLYTLLINWNLIFGINAKGDHWKEITFEQDEYIDTLYISGRYTYASWFDYRHEINDLSNTFISFPDPFHHKNQEYNLEGIKVSLEVTHHWLHKLAANSGDILTSEESKKWPLSKLNYIEELKKEINAAVNNS